MNVFVSPPMVERITFAVQGALIFFLFNNKKKPSSFEYCVSKYTANQIVVSVLESI